MGAEGCDVFSMIWSRTQSTAMRIQSTFRHQFTRTLLCNLTLLNILYPPLFQTKFCKRYQSRPRPATDKTLTFFNIRLMRSYCSDTITLWLPVVFQLVFRKEIKVIQCSITDTYRCIIRVCHRILPWRWRQNFVKCIPLCAKLHRVLRIMCTKLQDVILWTIFSKKCYKRTSPIINQYIATSILEYVCGWTCKYYDRYLIVLDKWKESYVSDNTTTERRPLRLNLLYNVCVRYHHNTETAIWTIQIYMSGNTTKTISVTNNVTELFIRVWVVKVKHGKNNRSLDNKMKANFKLCYFY